MCSIQMIELLSLIMMHKQVKAQGGNVMEEMRVNESSEEKYEIPINTRIIGMPGGAVVLYLEDYVHTFIKKLLEQDNTQTWTVDLYGIIIENSQSENFLVQGAVETGTFRLPISGERYFPKSHFIGCAQITQNFNDEICILLQPQQGSKIKIESFYVYYDQNEEMQNYLIEWNLQHQDLHIRREKDETVRYGRILQAQNREEVKVSALWNFMNVLCLGFVICVMVYAVNMINSYKKMEEMRDALNYIVEAMPKQQDLIATDEIENQTLSAETDWRQIEEIQSKETTTETIEAVDTKAINTESVNDEPPSTETVQTEIQSRDAQVWADNSVNDGEQKNNTQPKTYYIVQKGDTLRSISFQIYGNYDYVDEICIQNGLNNPDSILYGQKLLLP